MFLVFATACASVAVSAFFVLPHAAGSVISGYLASLRRLPVLYVRHAPLRLAAGRGALWFFAFCAVWAGVGVALSQPPFSYSSERIGVYAFAGLLGIVAARVAGAWTDRVGARKVLLAGLVVALTAAVILGFTQVANQSTVLALDPAAPAQFNSAYMLIYFVGGSLGTAFGAAAVGCFGWPTTTVVAAGAIALAMIVTATIRVNIDH